MTNIRVHERVLSQEECDRLIGQSSAQLTRAKFWTKGERVFDPQVRDAYNYKWQDAGLAELTRSLAAQIAGEAIAVERVEPVEIVCYPPGNGNERHLDGPHRSHSIVYFLNHGYAGGVLVFDDGREFTGLPAGSAVVWENNSESWHACTPIISGFKWVVVNWVRFHDATESEAEVHARIKREAAEGDDATRRSADLVD